MQDNQQRKLQRNHQSPDEEIAVIFRSVWEEGVVETAAKLNLASGRVTEIQVSGEGEEFESLVREEVEVFGICSPVDTTPTNDYQVTDLNRLAELRTAVEAKARQLTQTGPAGGYRTTSGYVRQSKHMTNSSVKGTNVVGGGQRKLQQKQKADLSEDYARRAGFQVHHGDVTDGRLHGRWWWTVMQPRWSGAEMSEGDWATENEAWIDAIQSLSCDKELLRTIGKLQQEQQSQDVGLARVLADLVQAVEFAPLGVRGIKAVEAAKVELGKVPGSGYSVPARKLQQGHSATISREDVADSEFEAYEFGDGVQVVEHDNWNYDDPDDYTKIVYVKFDDDAPDADSHKVSFHVRFNPDGTVSDAYALEMRHGNDIGVRGKLQSELAAEGVEQLPRIELNTAGRNRVLTVFTKDADRTFVIPPGCSDKDALEQEAQRAEREAAKLFDQANALKESARLARIAADLAESNDKTHVKSPGMGM